MEFKLVKCKLIGIDLTKCMQGGSPRPGIEQYYEGVLMGNKIRLEVVMVGMLFKFPMLQGNKGKKI